MGLDDRDYMRNRNRGNLDRMLKDLDRPFTPPEQKPSWLLMVLTWACVGFVAYKGWGLWQAHEAARVVAAPPVQSQRYEPQPPPSRPRETSTGALAAYAPPSQVYQAPAPERVERPQTGGTVYLCRQSDGSTFWASNHCSQHGAVMDRMVSVPEGMPFQQQVAIAEERRRALTQSVPIQVATTPAAPSASTERIACPSLAERVNQLDAMARQPQTAATQDWIRIERQKTRDEQFRLRC